jgi:hypothetical protein
MKLSPVFDFINVQPAAFASKDPEIAKKTDNLIVFFGLSDLPSQ